MTRQDEPGPKKTGSGEEADESLAAAETRVLPEEEAAELETRVVLDDAEGAENPENAANQNVGAAQLAETVVQGGLDGSDDAAATVVAEAEESSDAPLEEDDRTQLITRVPSSSGHLADETGDAGDDSAASAGEVASSDRAGQSGVKETRVLDPSVVANPGPGDGAGSDRLPDTRVLEERDKTSPPAVDEAAAPAAAVAASRSAPPSSPNPPIDADRGLAPGTVLFGEYEIVNVLGVGGMGEVYRAKHRRLGEHRAIKVMHAELSKKKGASEFFYREAKALLAVRHPAVAHCHDMLSDDAGRVYLIMEMIEGIPLSKKMNDGPLSPDEVALLGARVSHGLAAAHRKGVIHRDVSPDNIVLPNGRVQEAKIIDFGIAKLLEEGEGTIVDGFKGKLSYASPEQLGFFGGKIDGRSDFYSLGLVLVAAAQGRPMQMGTTVVEAVDARRAFETLPDSIPIGLRSAIQPLLALDPDDRPRYVDRLFVVPGREGSGDTGAIATGAIERSGGSKSAPANRTGMIAGGVAAAALLLGGGVYLGLGGTLGTSPTDSVSETPATNPDSTATGAANATGSPTATAVTEPAAAPVSPPALAPALAVAPAPVAPVVPKARRLSAGDRIRIIGLVNNAKLALEENRLMSPANDNAYDRYKRILALDPNESRAKAGLRTIATRYVSMADRAIDQGKLDQARTYLDRARRADASYDGIAALERRLRN